MAKNSETVSLGLKLDGNNFPVWSQLMQMAIGSREKLDHIEDDTDQPKSGDPEYKAWRTADYTVFSWLIQNMEPKLVMKFSQHQTSRALWKSLMEEPYDHVRSESRSGPSLRPRGQDEQTQSRRRVPRRLLGRIAEPMGEHRLTQNLPIYLLRQGNQYIPQRNRNQEVVPVSVRTKRQIRRSPAGDFEGDTDTLRRRRVRICQTRSDTNKDLEANQIARTRIKWNRVWIQRSTQRTTAAQTGSADATKKARTTAAPPTTANRQIGVVLYPLRDVEAYKRYMLSISGVPGMVGGRT